MWKKSKAALIVTLFVAVVGIIWGLSLRVDACGGGGCGGGHNDHSGHQGSHNTSDKSWGQATISGQVNVNSVRDIVDNYGSYINKTVCVQGRIKDECPSGGSFTLDDGTGKVFVDLHKSSFNIPQLADRKVKVFGNLESSEDKLSIIGKRVELAN